jgi:hypothetical protein
MIDYELQKLFNDDSVNKKMYIKYPSGTITNTELHEEEFTLTETLSTEDELVFGSCETSSVSFTVSNVFNGLDNALLDISVVLDHNENKAFKIGKYKVYSNVPTADRVRRKVLAYDAMYDVINADVATWYNTILPNADSSVTLREFRSSFFDYFGIEQVEITLPNDDMVVKKTVQTDKLSGKDVVTAICEVNGCFGHINRDGKMDYVFLKERIDAIYPSDDLFPAEDLYPNGNNYETFNTGNYYGCQYEDYVVKKIDALEIREQENSLGISVGDGNNRYIINGNMLLLGKTEEELTVIAQKIFDVIKHIEYRPFEATMRANLCRELGDMVRFNTKYDIFYSYILERRVTGIQNIIDTMSANGEEYRTAQVNNLQSDVLQLRGKTNILERNIDETRSEITKIESKANEYTDEKLKNYPTTEIMNSVISQTADDIALEVSKEYTTKDETTKLSARIDTTAEGIESEVKRATKAEGELSSRITQTADEISSKVEKGEVISEINQSAEQVKIQASKIALEGTVTANGNVTIGTDGKITAKNGSFSGAVDATSISIKDKITMYSAGYTLPQILRDIIYYNQVYSDDYKPIVIGDGRSAVEVRGNLSANLVGKVECSDNSQRYAIGTLDTSANRRIAYIASNAKNNDGAYYVTVNGQWESGSYSSHSIISASSDIRLKENVKPTQIKNALDVVNKFGVYEFDWKESGAHQKIGFIADYLQEVDERLAVGGDYEEDGTPNYKSVDNFYMQGYIVKALQELSAENRELKSEIDELKQSVSFLLEKLGGMDNE